MKAATISIRTLVDYSVWLKDRQPESATKSCLGLFLDICTTFYSLTFPFLTPHSLHHSPSTMIYLPQKLSRIFLCFYNIQGVA
jgi:hypothetical protein